jgi:hypothetical protein
MSTQSNLLQTSFASGFKVFTTKEHLYWSYRASLYNNFTIFLKHLVMNMDGSNTRFLLMVHKQTWEKMGYPWNKRQ